MDPDDDTYKQYEIKEGVAFLIELSPAIYAPLSDLGDECQLFEILRCISDLMAEMVVTFPKNGIGIYLYHCTETGSKFPKNSGMTKVFSLNDLNSSNMKTLANMVRDQMDGFQPLEKRFPCRTDTMDNLHPVLKTVLREFQVKPQYNVKKLLWFTNNDKPYVNEDLKDSLRTIISDFEDNRIYISPIFLDTFADAQQRQKRPFDSARYENIFLNTNYLQRPNTAEPFAEDETPWTATTVALQIRGAIFRLKEVRRIQFACDLVLSDGPGVAGNLGCSVKGYTLYNHEKIRSFRQVHTEGEALRLVHNESHYVRGDTQHTIPAGDPQDAPLPIKGVPVKLSNGEVSGANERVLLLNDDVVEYMKGYSFDHDPSNGPTDKSEAEQGADEAEAELNYVSFSKPPYLKLLCFRKMGTFQPYFNTKLPVFVTADLSDGLNSASKEGGYTNLLQTFRALYQACVKLQKYAVVIGCIKKNALPDIYALYPTNASCSSMQADKRDAPDGFLLVHIPWLSEIRSLPDYMMAGSGYFHGEATASQLQNNELTELYKKLLGSLGTLSSYNPTEHENPVLNYFYKIIKHEALQIDIKDEDTSLAKNDWTTQQAMEFYSKAQGSQSKDVFNFINVYLNKVGNLEVMKRSAEMNKLPLKRVKNEPLTEAAIITMWKNNTWNNVTVAQLKEFIGRYGKIQSASRRADMISNIVSFLETRKAN